MTGPVDVVRPGRTGVLDEDLRAAALAALDRDVVARMRSSRRGSARTAQFLPTCTPTMH